jgi:hypothetical protein
MKLLRFVHVCLSLLIGLGLITNINPKFGIMAVETLVPTINYYKPSHGGTVFTTSSDLSGKWLVIVDVTLNPRDIGYERNDTDARLKVSFKEVIAYNTLFNVTFHALNYTNVPKGTYWSFDFFEMSLIWNEDLRDNKSVAGVRGNVVDTGFKGVYTLKFTNDANNTETYLSFPSYTVENITVISSGAYTDANEKTSRLSRKFSWFKVWFRPSTDWYHPIAYGMYFVVVPDSSYVGRLVSISRIINNFASTPVALNLAKHKAFLIPSSETTFKVSLQEDNNIRSLIAPLDDSIYNSLQQLKGDLYGHARDDPYEPTNDQPSTWMTDSEQAQKYADQGFDFATLWYYENVHGTSEYWNDLSSRCNITLIPGTKRTINLGYDNKTTYFYLYGLNQNVTWNSMSDIDFSKAKFVAFGLPGLSASAHAGIFKARDFNETLPYLHCMFSQSLDLKSRVLFDEIPLHKLQEIPWNFTGFAAESHQHGGFRIGFRYTLLWAEEESPNNILTSLQMKHTVGCYNLTKPSNFKFTLGNSIVGSYMFISDENKIIPAKVIMTYEKEAPLEWRAIQHKDIMIIYRDPNWSSSCSGGNLEFTYYVKPNFSDSSWDYNYIVGILNVTYREGNFINGRHENINLDHNSNAGVFPAVITSPIWTNKVHASIDTLSSVEATNPITFYNFANQRLSLTVAAPSGTMSITKVFCGDKGKPEFMTADGSRINFDYNYTTKIANFTTLSSGSNEVVMSWERLGVISASHSYKSKWFETNQTLWINITGSGFGTLRVYCKIINSTVQFRGENGAHGQAWDHWNYSTKEIVLNYYAPVQISIFIVRVRSLFWEWIVGTIVGIGVLGYALWTIRERIKSFFQMVRVRVGFT